MVTSYTRACWASPKLYQIVAERWLMFLRNKCTSRALTSENNEKRPKRNCSFGCFCVSIDLLKFSLLFSWNVSFLSIVSRSGFQLYYFLRLESVIMYVLIEI